MVLLAVSLSIHSGGAASVHGRSYVLAPRWFQRYPVNKTSVEMKSVKAKVTKRGLLIPKEMLAGIEEVDIRKEDNRIVISPLIEGDPILDLGQHPVECGVSDASEHHDRYLYGSES